MKVKQEGTIEIEVQELDRDPTAFRARIIGTDLWWTAHTEKSALSGATINATRDEVLEGLGDLWEAGDPFEWEDVGPEDIDDLPNDLGVADE